MVISIDVVICIEMVVTIILKIRSELPSGCGNMYRNGSNNECRERIHMVNQVGFLGFSLVSFA